MIPSFFLKHLPHKTNHFYKLGPVHIISDPEHVSEILLSQSDHFGKGGGMWDAIRPLLGEGLITAEGSRWKEQRQRANPFFSKLNIDVFSRTITEIVLNEVTTIFRKIKIEEVIDIAPIMRNIAQKLLLALLFGSKDSDLGEDFHQALSVMNRKLFLYFLPAWSIPGNCKFNRAIEQINRKINMLATDFFGNSQLTEKERRDQLVTLYVAGSDTVAAAATWMLLMLAKHPHNGQFPLNLDLVIKETIRLYPPIWFFPRFAIEETTIGTKLIKKGSVVVLSPLLTQRSQSLWGNLANEFIPTRNYPEQKFAYYPFGGGARKCIGEYLALKELKVIAEIFLAHFTLELTPKTNLELSSSTTLWPAYAEIKLKRVV